MIAHKLKQKVKKGKPGRNNHGKQRTMSRSKCGTLVLNGMQEAIQLDDCNSNASWVEAIAKEMNGLGVLNVFDVIITIDALQQIFSMLHCDSFLK